MTRSVLIKMTTAAMMVALTGPTASAQHADETVQIQEAQSQDLYEAGRDVRVLAPVDGDVVAAGQTIIIDSAVGDDVIVAGGTLAINQAVGDDVRAAGQSVRIAGSVGGHVVAAGQTVVVESGQRVGDWAWLAGSRVEVAGSVGSLRAAGERVTITGEVRGDADVVGEYIEIGPGAVIQGDLVWRSANEPIVSDTAQVVGEVIEQPLPVAGPPAVALSLIMPIAALLAVVVLRLTFPRIVPEVGAIARTEWLGSLGLGLVVLVVVPIVAMLLLATAIGWLLGLMLMFSYAVMLMAGGLMGLYSVSALLLKLAGGHGVSVGVEIAAIAGTALALLLISWTPFLGVVSLLVFLLGLGALALHTVRSYRASPQLV